MEIIQMHFLKRAVKFTELCATLQDVVNPNLSAFTSSASLSSPQQVQSSDDRDINHELKGNFACPWSIIMLRSSLDHTM